MSPCLSPPGRLLAVLALAGSLLLPLGCGSPPEAREAPRPVRAVQVGASDQLAARTFPGRAEATQSATISARVSGPLTELPVSLGVRVEQGDLIARIDPRDFETEVRQARNALAEAEANLMAMRAGARPEEVRALEAALASAESSLREARQQFERMERLLAEEVVPRADYDRAETALENAGATAEEARQRLEIARSGARGEDIEATEARVESLRARLERAEAALRDTEIRAPFAGHISEKYVENFQFVREQQALVRLQDSSRIEVRIGVPEAAIIMAGYVTGVICRFEPFPGREFRAEIEEVGTNASPETQTYPVVVALDNPPDVALLPGMTATVEIQAELPEGSDFAGIPVPASAIVAASDGSSSLWVLEREAGVVRRREVRTGGLTASGMLVTEGLSGGEWVVTAGAHFLREGQRVRLLDGGSQ